MCIRDRPKRDHYYLVLFSFGLVHRVLSKLPPSFKIHVLFLKLGTRRPGEQPPYLRIIYTRKKYSCFGDTNVARQHAPRAEKGVELLADEFRPGPTWFGLEQTMKCYYSTNLLFGFLKNLSQNSLLYM